MVIEESFQAALSPTVGTFWRQNALFLLRRRLLQSQCLASCFLLAWFLGGALFML